MYPEEYIHFLAHFHGDRDYFECHEILEEYWKKSNDQSKDSIWVGLILLAVSAYHHRRANFNGAGRTLNKAIHIFTSQQNTLPKIGLEKQTLFSLLTNQLAIIKKEEAYQSYHLPITDPFLLKDCIKKCEQIGYSWNTASNLSDKSLVDRHILRDRSSVIQERIDAIIIKKGNDS
ncbi:DUF309 domain-containing protein [Neobacillus sp. FSL H8-0543]|uniref:DUF309 domain-containing protein n=1 Tax=Neobacillus sp. FSL H8-0543 TaxID=2954672 RepID=UPI0031591C7D